MKAKLLISMLLLTCLLCVSTVAATETTQTGFFSQIIDFFKGLFTSTDNETKKESEEVVELNTLSNETCNASLTQEINLSSLVKNHTQVNKSEKEILHTKNISQNLTPVNVQTINISTKQKEPICEGITDDLGKKCQAKNWEAALNGEPVPYFDTCEQAKEWYEGSPLGPRASCDLEFKECYEECSDENWYLVCDMMCTDNNFASCYTKCSPESFSSSCDNKCD